MTERRKTKEITERSYTDTKGIPRVSLIPDGESNMAMGIPVSLDVTRLYSHMPDSFQAELTAALHAVGLVKPQDYFQDGASDRFRAAMLSVIRHDFSNVMALAKEELSHGR